MMRMKDIVTAAALLCSSCASKVTLWSYDIPKEVDYVFPFVSTHLCKDDLRSTINDVAASGFLERSYLDSLDGMKYSLRYVKEPLWQGIIKHKGKIEFTFSDVPPYLGEDAVHGLIQSSALLYIAFHEFGHDFFYRNFTIDERLSFRTAFISCIEDYDMVHGLDVLRGDDPLPDSVYALFGLTRCTYDDIRLFLKEKDYYHKSYVTEDCFQSNYYSSEAFARIFSNEMTNKFMALNELLADRKRPGILAPQDIESARNDICNMLHIPDRLRPYYSGLIRKDFIDGNVNVDRLLEGKRFVIE